MPYYNLSYLINIEHDVRKTVFLHKESQILHVKESLFFCHEFFQQLSTITSRQRKVLAGAFALHIGQGQVSLTRKPTVQARQALTRCGRKPWQNDGHRTVHKPRASHSEVQCSQCSRCNPVSICTTSRSVYTLNHENGQSSCCMSSFRC